MSTNLRYANESLQRLAVEVRRLAVGREQHVVHYAESVRRAAEAAEQRGLERGRREGREEGHRTALLTTLERLCASLALEFETRRSQLEAATAEELLCLVHRVFEARAWPDE